MVQRAAQSPLFEQMPVLTGKETVFRALYTPWGAYTIEEGESFEHYQSVVTQTGLLDGLFAGIRLISETRMETYFSPSVVDYETAKAQAAQDAYAKLLELCPWGLMPVESRFP
jgi:hypothetical protein